MSGSSAGENSTCRIFDNSGTFLGPYHSHLYYGSGGGLHVLFWFSYLANHSSNSTKCHFEGNRAYLKLLRKRLKLIQQMQFFSVIVSGPAIVVRLEEL